MNDSNVQNLLQLMKILYGDIFYSIEKMKSEENDFDYYARSYLRAYASWVEGSVWLYKEVIRKIEYQWHKNLPLASQLYLFEYDWDIKNSGQPELRQKKVRTKDNLKGFFFVMNQIFDDYSVNTNCNEWSDVQYFYGLRDKLMHPSNVAQLAISKDDIKRCDIGRVWLHEQFTNLSAAIQKRCDA